MPNYKILFDTVAGFVAGDVVEGPFLGPEDVDSGIPYLIKIGAIEPSDDPLFRRNNPGDLQAVIADAVTAAVAERDQTIQQLSAEASAKNQTIADLQAQLDKAKQKS